MLNFLMDWLGKTPLHDFMINNTVAFIAAETLHFIGLTMLIGALFVIDMRGLGLFKRLPLLAVHRLVPVAIAGFLINLATGIGFIAYQPSGYADNLAFQVKLVLILLAGLNAIAFEFLVFRPAHAGAPGAETSAAAKITSGASLLLWAGVLIMGRLIPYA